MVTEEIKIAGRTLIVDRKEEEVVREKDTQLVEVVVVMKENDAITVENHITVVTKKVEDIEGHLAVNIETNLPAEEVERATIINTEWVTVMLITMRKVLQIIMMTIGKEEVDIIHAEEIVVVVETIETMTDIMKEYMIKNTNKIMMMMLKQYKVVEEIVQNMILLIKVVVEDSSSNNLFCQYQRIK